MSYDDYLDNLNDPPVESEYTAALKQAIERLTIERDAARANARPPAHSYTHDSRSPQCAVDDSLLYPAIPEGNQ